MASNPGVLTDWPWKCLGSFKYVILAPWAAYCTYSYMSKGEKERDFSSFVILPFLLWRMLHNQIWISLSRHQTAKGAKRILDRSIEDDQILFNGVIFYIAILTIPGTTHLPFWRTDGVVQTILLHVGPVEFLYYWLHRALHHHYLYSRYHSHHHSSIVTEPNSSVTHPFAEHIGYFLLFAIPLYITVLIRTISIVSVAGYITYIDFMNYMGHCNFELIPYWLFSIFPPLKYLMYTPSFHSLHHTQFRTNYSLFMPIYDYIYGTLDHASDQVYENAFKRPEDSPDVVHLTHLTTPESIYHLRLGFASLASKPQKSRWYIRLLWPVTFWSMVVALFLSRTFTVERNIFKKLKLQTWAIPKYSMQYFFKWQKEAINGLIEEAILEAEGKGTKGEELNKSGEVHIQKYPQLKVKVVDGSSLAVAVVLNSIPTSTTQVLFRGNLSKVAYAIVLALCQKGIQVATLRKSDYEKVKAKIPMGDNLIWLVGDGFSDEEQLKAPRGTVFIPFFQLPPKELRKDCSYHFTPAMIAPMSLENLDSCENGLPRRVMSAWRVAGIVHALEGWNVHECGDTMFDIERVWQASLQHGFRPLIISKAQSE
ncbi:putative domain Wax2, C-terminal [Dillenia turbinata]|uniref:Domain Wax2, C-terminal n=1 Tax=Dillenia turbinata TaxID=194707 RepID=A0AAN8USL8_9MAGN